MWAERNDMCEIHNQNPGDLRIPEGTTLIPFTKVLIIDAAARVDPSQYEVIALLPGQTYPLEDERAILEETTLPQAGA